MPTSKVRRKARGHRRHAPAPWRTAAAVSSPDPAGLPEIMFPGDVTGGLRPDFTGMDLDFVVVSPGAAELARLALRFERQWATTAAVDVWGQDSAKALAAHIRVQKSGRWTLDLRTAADPLYASQARLILIRAP